VSFPCHKALGAAHSNFLKKIWTDGIFPCPRVNEGTYTSISNTGVKIGGERNMTPRIVIRKLPESCVKSTYANLRLCEHLLADLQKMSYETQSEAVRGD